MKRMLLFALMLIVFVPAFAVAQSQYRPNVPRAAQRATTIVTKDNSGYYNPGGTVAGYVRDVEYGYVLDKSEVRMSLWRRTNNQWEKVVETTCVDPNGYYNQGCLNSWDGYYTINKDKWGNPLSAGAYYLLVTATNRKSVFIAVNLSGNYVQKDIDMEVRDQYTWLEPSLSYVRGNNLTLTVSVQVPYTNNWYMYEDETLMASVTAYAEKDGEKQLVAVGNQKVKVNPGFYWTQTVKLGGGILALADYPKGAKVCAEVVFTDANKTVVGRIDETCFAKEPASVVVQPVVLPVGQSIYQSK